MKQKMFEAIAKHNVHAGVPNVSVQEPNAHVRIPKNFEGNNISRSQKLEWGQTFDPTGCNYLNLRMMHDSALKRRLINILSLWARVWLQLTKGAINNGSRIFMSSMPKSHKWLQILSLFVNYEYDFGTNCRTLWAIPVFG